MAATVKLFARGRLVYANKDQRQAGTDNVLLVSEPYLARASISATATPAASTAALAPDAARLLQIQVQNGKRVAIRVTTVGSTESADTSDPEYSGEALIPWGPGHTLSVVEIT